MFGGISPMEGGFMKKKRISLTICCGMCEIEGHCGIGRQKKTERNKTRKVKFKNKANTLSAIY